MEWQRVGDFYILFDKEDNKKYTLDPISFLVWVQCDGKAALEQIVDVFSINGNRDIVRGAILAILKKLTDSGLIKWL
jgi:hypothetical protein